MDSSIEYIIQKQAEITGSAPPIDRSINQSTPFLSVIVNNNARKGSFAVGFLYINGIVGT